MWAVWARERKKLWHVVGLKHDSKAVSSMGETWVSAFMQKIGTKLTCLRCRASGCPKQWGERGDVQLLHGGLACAGRWAENGSVGWR